MNRITENAGKHQSRKFLREILPLGFNPMNIVTLDQLLEVFDLMTDKELDYKSFDFVRIDQSLPASLYDYLLSRELNAYLLSIAKVVVAELN